MTDKIEVTDFAWLRRELTPHGNGTWVGAIMTNIDLAIATARAEGHRAGMIEAAGIARTKRSEWLTVGDLPLAVSAAEEIAAAILLRRSKP